MYLLVQKQYHYPLRVFFVFHCIIQCIYGWKYDYSPTNYYDGQQQQTQYDLAINKLKDSPQWVPDWPNPSVKMGQVAGVALDNSGRLLAFHRSGNSWGIGTFNDRNVYAKIGDPPIARPTIFIFNETGEIVDMWGQNLFYMPHGITVDKHDNVWLTDVALHQVFKFSAQDRTQPALVLGEKFVPGDDEEHFCKPSAVAVMSSGEFFVADGYCNSRIIKYSPEGVKILEWGQRHGTSVYTLAVPHALTLADEEKAICVADRERGRVACFSTREGQILGQHSSWLIGGKCFSVAAAAGKLYLVNGPYGNVPRIRGFVLDFGSGRLEQSFGPHGDFLSPHDLVVSPDGASLYVAQLDPHRVFKFVDLSLANATREEHNRTLSPGKPTATVEWRGAAGGGGGGWWAVLAAGAGGAGVAGLAGAALLRARGEGRKGGRGRWDYGGSEFKLRRLLERRRFTRVDTSDSEDDGPRLTAAA